MVERCARLQYRARVDWLRFLLGVGLTVAADVCVGAAAEPARVPGRWQELFDGRTLAGWGPSEFETGGAITVVNPFRDGRGAIVIEKGTTLSGITWTRGAALPRSNYEIALEAMKLEGDDFFCGLTFPVGKTACTLVVGGWGGTVTGISSIDHADAVSNETTTEREFAPNRWYRIRVRVTDQRLQAWIDDEPCVDLELAGRRIGLRPGEIQKSLPLGIATYMTTAAVRDIRLRRW